MPKPIKPVEVRSLGLMPYSEALKIQHQTVAQLKSDANAIDQLLIVEHPDVYTVGRKGQRLSAPFSVPVVEVERGGDITFHNPGQLVAYPLMRLEGREQSVPGFLRGLEVVIIDVLGRYGIRAESRPNETGVWLEGQKKKIASIGVAFSKWVSFHGVALNVNNDLSGFHRVRPCGYSAGVMTSVREQTGSEQDLEALSRHFVSSFCGVFGREALWVGPQSALQTEAGSHSLNAF